MTATHGLGVTQQTQTCAYVGATDFFCVLPPNLMLVWGWTTLTLIHMYLYTTTDTSSMLLSSLISPKWTICLTKQWTIGLVCNDYFLIVDLTERTRLSVPENEDDVFMVNEPVFTTETTTGIFFLNSSYKSVSQGPTYASKAASVPTRILQTCTDSSNTIRTHPIGGNTCLAKTNTSKLATPGKKPTLGQKPATPGQKLAYPTTKTIPTTNTYFANTKSTTPGKKPTTLGKKPVTPGQKLAYPTTKTNPTANTNFTNSANPPKQATSYTDTKAYLTKTNLAKPATTLGKKPAYPDNKIAPSANPNPGLTETFKSQPKENCGSKEPYMASYARPTASSMRWVGGN